MEQKSYSNAGNAARAARTALKNPNAKPGTDFQVDKVDVGKYVFKVLNGKPRKAKRAPGEKSPILAQPRAVQVLGIVSAAGEQGITLVALVQKLGKVAPHTVRGLVSRMRSEGATIESVREGRTIRYRKPKAA